ncbi:hypothetical protein ACTZGB_18375 [Yersinia bercovieri]|uniref:hypothetical protein n=1 Tax=Yersinia bercovieri TaxID=634 RepID=UPI003FD807C3
MSENVKKTLSDYDVRQISLMKDIIVSYESNKIPLADLIDRLRGLLDCLQSVDESWMQSFHDSWFTLEQVYAVVLDQGDTLDNYSEYIEESISNLKILLGM